MKLPDGVQALLIRKFQYKHREWLQASSATSNGAESAWPMEISLGAPTEQAALRQPEGVRAWTSAWRNWQGAGTLVWSDRRWRSLGTQRVPDKLILSGPTDVALWIGETTRWAQANVRYAALVDRWPALLDALPKHFTVLADYSDADFCRLIEMLSWINANPNSNLYLRQLPISGLDSKWLESRKSIVSELLATIQANPLVDRDFYQRCGLKPQPLLIRLRILDPELRSRFGGLGDISAPWEQVAAMDIPLTQAFIVENLQTGLAFDDLPGSVVLMRLGYGVDVLGRLPWLKRARCIYWGDLDTHGFAILNRARTYLPDLETVLMDENTLLSHKELWGEETTPHAASELSLLSATEQELYQSLKGNKWAQNVRLEQERIAWDTAWRTLRSLIS